jgi:type I restriction enzyme M protein
LFYKPGIATYVWVLSKRKPAHRAGRVQRKNLGKKN